MKDRAGRLERERNIVSKALVFKVALCPKDGVLTNIKLAGGEMHDDVQTIQQYGFASLPSKNARALTLFVGGERDNGVVVATQGDSEKIPSIEEGEVALFTDYGQSIILKKDGSIVATPARGKTFSILGDLEVDGNVSATKEVSATCPKVGDNIDKTMGVHLSTHAQPTNVGPAGKPIQGT